ncbi:restriction endonuclease subunit S [bacterium]|nr:restriction endonuclease subunit S [bacterium]
MQYSVVNYKTVKENSDFRIDADYFRPDFLNSLELVNSHRNSTLFEISNVNGGKRLPLNENFSDDGIPYIRAEDIKNGFVQYENSPKISFKLHETLKRYQTKKDDVLLTIVGNSIGEVGLVKFDILKCNLTENCAKVTNLESIIPEFLFVFLLSKHGQIQIHREKVGTAQPKLALIRIRKFKIPVFSNEFQKTISKIINQANSLIDQSKSLYFQAEQLLLSELGLLERKPKHGISFIKNFSDTKESERFDAEYFQPKYEEIIEAVKKYTGGFDELGSLVNIKDKKIMPEDSEQYKYIELANISSNGEIKGYTENFGNELPSRARRKVQKGDLIISSIEGSLESIALITEDWENALCSTGFFVIISDKINSETLLVLLKMQVGQLQLKKGCKGTILTAIGKDELSKIILPKIEPETQKQIKEKIIEMYKVKKLSKSLFEVAKCGVEIAIEKDEKDAQSWIDAELKKLKMGDQ